MPDINPRARMIYGYALRDVVGLMRRFYDNVGLRFHCDHICKGLGVSGDGISFVALRDGVISYEVYIGRVVTNLDAGTIIGGAITAEECVLALNKQWAQLTGDEGHKDVFTTADLTRTTPRFYIGCT